MAAKRPVADVDVLPKLDWRSFTERAKTVLFLASEIADEQRNNYIGAEHIQEALLRQPDDAPNWKLLRERLTVAKRD